LQNDGRLKIGKLRVSSDGGAMSIYFNLFCCAEISRKIKSLRHRLGGTKTVAESRAKERGKNL